MSIATPEISASSPIDRDILRLLQSDARMSFLELARHVHLSPNAVADRVRRLTRLGTIERFTVDIATQALGYHLQAFVDVKMRADQSADGFEKMLESVEGIREVILTTGSFDYTLRVACADQSDLVRLVEQLRVSGGVAETYSRIILRERRFGLLRANERRPGGRRARASASA
jgi:Lrp/AsnC family transcriptional regulator, leucine-responsive regulatory protein